MTPAPACAGAFRSEAPAGPCCCSTPSSPGCSSDASSGGAPGTSSTCASPGGRWRWPGWPCSSSSSRGRWRSASVAEGPAIYVASTLVVLAALLRNLALPGLTIVALGAVLNLVPVLANGGAMPSSPDAWLALNGVAELPVRHFSNSVLDRPGHALRHPGRHLRLAAAAAAGQRLLHRRCRHRRRSRRLPGGRHAADRGDRGPARAAWPHCPGASDDRRGARVRPRTPGAGRPGPAGAGRGRRPRSPPLRRSRRRRPGAGR